MVEEARNNSSYWNTAKNFIFDNILNHAVGAI
jgi:hypothetical protein